jgi:HEAT repeat protein
MKIFKAIIIALALTLGTAGTASAEYLPSDTTQADQVDSLDLMVRFLSEESYMPSRLELRHVSPDVVADLVEIATGRYNTKVRNRAIQSLALYRSDERAQQALEALLEQLSPSDKLFPGVIVAFAQMTGEESVEKLEEFASHSRTDVRMAAVVALGRFGGTAGFEHLNEIASAEENDVIRERIESYIR